MSTLLLRLSGPMQSWGTQSHFTRRDTGLEPSKSGVIGLLCAALGRSREAPVADLADLLMGVRVDGEGSVQLDYHTAGGTPRGDGTGYGVAKFTGGVRTVISYRAYLANACFLVGLEAASPDQEQLLHQLDAALANPVWPIFLGRKAFPPADPVRLPDAPPRGPGLRPLPLREALLQYPWPSRESQPLRFVFEDPSAQSGEIRQDMPVSYSSLDRRFAPRFIRTEFLTRPETTPVQDT